MANHHLLSALPQPSPITYGNPLSLQTGAKSNLTMSLNSDTSSLKRPKSTIPMSGVRQKRLSTTSSLVKRGSMMVMGEFGRDGSGDENIGLKRVNDGLNRTVAALRSRVSELESAIDHGTGPEVERLTKEVSTLEDLLEETQRDNEAKHAESERQKQYVKDLENLLTELAGLHWRIHHDTISPHVPTANSVTTSTPLPKPKPIHSLRHSVSFSNARSARKLHHRTSSSSGMAASSMALRGMGLQAVKEANGADNNTPTGTLKRLCGNSSTESEKIRQEARKAKRELEDVVLDKTPKPHDDLAVIEEPALSRATPGLKSCDVVDHEKLNQILGILLSLDPSKLLALNACPSAESHRCDEKTVRMRKQERTMLRRMLDGQEKRLGEREARLKWMVEMARAEEGKYDSRAC
ncbi:hypothetical protein C349_07053 [Cryptococcus neoformans var. grubii Br795]|uniref:Uncharacterized protein n=1 Tax=Cryptococcus neoformans Tu259-1 TaxID=1230072 RepID=A0A854QGM8_CRYNE|nr:hypothetical protein C353_06967 [Cryptococcus neoformans var. grubii AD1-83a]OXG24080.1 hypothetical protein C361_02629 [Cryptococcus neoformans var. grubii Tu259-1]OXG42138.1 hypothetical protein C354_06947 [Cryptococcus neoformans var. grubii MW-RSA1955]OXG46957.1 hypothetical protein C352_06971 [Cryptococcus neoformans var. grubii CHC193]OXG56041.1 hypothetical protein C351_06949 [Cryptococcus neoformans var. grubii c8]OXG71635.1 hypothetical protein C349_07053 [Cryptococcus neoformans v